MRKKLKELNFPVGNTPDVFPKIGGMRSADSTFSSHMAKTFTDEDKFSEEDEVEDSILRKRVKINGSYSLDQTLDRIDEFLDVGDLAGDAIASISRAGKGVTKMARDAGKSIVGAIPVVDVIFGSYRLAQLSQAIRDFSEKVSEKMNKPRGYFGDCLKSSNDNDWEELIYEFAILSKDDPKTGEEVKDLFNEVLENLKDFIITIIEAYDTIAGTVITLPTTGGTLTLPAIGFANIGTGLSGFAARTIPFERVLFSGGGYIAEGLKTILDLFLGNSEHSSTLDQMGEEGTIGRVKQSFNDIEKRGGSVMSAFLFSPVETLGRLNEFYRATGDPSLYLKAFERVIAEDKKYSILFLLESVEDKKPQKKYKKRKSHKFYQGGYGHQENPENDFFDFTGHYKDYEDSEEVLSEKQKKGFTDKYDDNEKLKGKQSELPDHLQKAIIGSTNETDLEEMSTTASLGGGPALPLGMKTPKMKDLEKAIKEQRERIAILQAYHQKTTNRLK